HLHAAVDCAPEQALRPGPARLAALRRGAASLGAGVGRGQAQVLLRGVGAFVVVRALGRNGEPVTDAVAVAGDLASRVARADPAAALTGPVRAVRGGRGAQTGERTVAAALGPLARQVVGAVAELDHLRVPV